MTLKHLLWLDFLLGFTTGIIGLIYFNSLETLLGIPARIIIIVGLITLLYAVVAILLAIQNSPHQGVVNVLVTANWVWSFVSLFLVNLYFSNAAVLGKVFLVLQVVVVGALAYFEGRALRHGRSEEQM
ncbi:MAG TPA: hypothetical protein VEB86_10330 [Chryseosolibacter sp.]|nr:hypothetical protein [Chryseosolibacter sp.]